MIKSVEYASLEVLLSWRTTKRVWVVKEAISLSFSTKAAKHNLEVPAGFETDLASIPRAVRSIIPQVGRQNLPAIVHDYTYREKSTAWLGKKKADLLFLEGMKICGVNWLRRSIIYRSVRMFGGWSYQVSD